MFRFNNLICEKCGAKLEILGKDLFITTTGSFVCGDCRKRFTLMKCKGCGSVFRNKNDNFVWKGKYSNKIHDKKPESSSEILIKCHKCPTGKICQEFYQFRLHPDLIKACYRLPYDKKDHSKELLEGDYKIQSTISDY